MAENEHQGEQIADSVIIREIDVGNEMVLAEVWLERLQESDINARMMPPREFETLVENIRKRGKLESIPYCAQPKGVGPIRIVSGHNRRKAALRAGITTAWVLIDRAEMTRSQMIAKQLAHNALVGLDDKDILAEMLRLIDNADDLLSTGIPQDALPVDKKFADIQILTPTLEFEQKCLLFMFLPHQFDRVLEWLKKYDEHVDLMVVGHESQWDQFVSSVAQFGRIKNIRAGGTAIAELLKAAKALLEQHDAESGHTQPKQS